jgi:hypothetical protein
MLVSFGRCRGGSLQPPFCIFDAAVLPHPRAADGETMISSLRAGAQSFSRMRVAARATHPQWRRMI